jgi:hypothetical protein
MLRGLGKDSYHESAPLYRICGDKAVLLLELVAVSASFVPASRFLMEVSLVEHLKAVKPTDIEINTQVTPLRKRKQLDSFLVDGIKLASHLCKFFSCKLPMESLG